MIIDRVLSVAKPYLKDQSIVDAVLGLSLIGIELDNKDIGLAYMLRDRLPAGCSSFGFAQEIIGANAYQVAKLARDGEDDAQKGVGMAVLTAGTRQLDLPDEDDKDPYLGLDVRSDDVVGMIGFIPPIAKSFSEKVRELIIFDKGISHIASGNLQFVKPMDMQAQLLPKCDTLIISGTTVINQTIDDLLNMCSGAREIIMIGSSTPMYPEAFQGTKVKILAGAWWDNQYKSELFKKISLSCGISHIKKFMIKKAIRVD